MLKDKNYQCREYLYFSYLSRGIYVDQLKNWMNFFPKEQFLILKYEDFVDDPPRVFKQVLNFLKLPTRKLKEYKASNAGKYSSGMNTTTLNRLIDYFEPHNERLYEFLGINFN